MKILKNRFFYAAVSAMIALVLCFIVAPALVKEKSAVVDVVKVKNDVQEGTILTADMLTTETVGAYGLSEETITDMDAAIGLVPLHDLSPRDFIYQDELVDASRYGKGGGMEDQVGEGQSLISITMTSAATSVSGLPAPGDMVDVFYAHTSTTVDEFGYTTEKTVAMHPDLLQNMIVYAVMNDSLASTTAPAADGRATDSVPAVITFIATPEQEAMLVELEHSTSDTIHLVLKG